MVLVTHTSQLAAVCFVTGLVALMVTHCQQAAAAAASAGWCRYLYLWVVLAVLPCTWLDGAPPSEPCGLPEGVKAFSYLQPQQENHHHHSPSYALLNTPPPCPAGPNLTPIPPTCPPPQASFLFPAPQPCEGGGGLYTGRFVALRPQRDVICEL